MVSYLLNKVITDNSPGHVNKRYRPLEVMIDMNIDFFGLVRDKT